MAALTRNDIPGVHGILILDETEAIHQLDLSDGAIRVLEVALNILFGDCRRRDTGQLDAVFQSDTMALIRSVMGTILDGSCVV